ncbi:YceI family protein [Zobellia alginiliquefaciens]|uniref:YceI family protein n=1 Tax=Zobellia alginiliquefaciens TaxID=3032586 RepID=UPI0023E42ED4|nr:YceI family protein [Zobellia alginiliquefaciens]
MKPILVIFTALLFSGNMLVLAQNPANITSAKVTFHFISKNVEGSLSGFESESKIDLSAISSSQFKGSVDAETIKTGNFLRDWHLKSKKYFNTDDYPKINFESTEIKETADGFSVTGTLTLKGTSKPITIKFIRKPSQLVGTTTLFTSDYGIPIQKERAENKVVVTILLHIYAEN